MIQLSHLFMTTGKTIALIRWNTVGKVISLLFNMLSRSFLPRSKRLLISWLQSLSVVILEPKKIGTDSHCQGKPVSSALDVVFTLLETWFPNMASEKRRQIVQGSVPIPP